MSADMKERPILFNGPMVRALLAGAKTQTRRVVKARRWDAAGRDGDGKGEWCTVQPMDGWTPEIVARDYPCPYGIPGDRLWVRETWCPVDDREHGGGEWIDYRATPRYLAEHPAGWENAPDDAEALKWRPSIHMPRGASRLTLEITDVRVERVRDITEADAEAEGITKSGVWWDVGVDWEGDGADTSASGVFRSLWDSINAKRGHGWDTNPWVWAITFRRVEAPTHD